MLNAECALEIGRKWSRIKRKENRKCDQFGEVSENEWLQ